MMHSFRFQPRVLHLLIVACSLHQVCGVRDSASTEVETDLESVKQKEGRPPLTAFYDGEPHHPNGKSVTFPKKEECIIVQRGDTWDVEILGEAPEKGWKVQSLLHSASADPDDPNDHADWVSPLEGPSKFRLVVPATAAVGQYELALDEGGTGFGFSESKDVCLIVLFNAACEQCEEFVDSPVGRSEFVEQTHGLIWRGNALANAGYYWSYDQFRYVNLRVAVDLLRGLFENEGLTELQHSSAVEVARELSYTINAHVCTGKWDGTYTEGTTYKCGAWPEQCSKPSDWYSSTHIIEQHWALRQKEGNDEYAAQFCQCWVFAGLMTTLGRALGLPIRPVTNFESAHDSNNDRAISKFYWSDEDGNIRHLNAVEACPEWCGHGIDSEEAINDCDFGNATCLDELRRGVTFSDNCRACARCIPCASGGDSKWNFHVWNEVYLKRKDVMSAGGVRASASGWQAVDATPQEESHGRMQMGPAPLTLVSEAAEACYDSKFVAAEVNADFKVYVLTGISKEDDAYDGKGYFEMTEGSALYLNRRWVNEPFGSSGAQRKKGVGDKVLTKNPGSLPLNCRKPGSCKEVQAMDVTSFYKKPGFLIGIDPAGYVPLQCTRLDEDEGSDIDSNSIETEETVSQQDQSDLTNEVDPVVLPEVEQPVEYSASQPGSNPSFAEVATFKRRGSTKAGPVVEAQRLTDLGVIFGGDVRMDTVFLIKGLSRTWTQQELVSRDPLLGVWPGEETVVSVSMQNLNMQHVRNVVLSITATPVDYRGKPFVYKSLRNRKVHAKVQFHQSGSTRIRQSGALLPGGGVQPLSNQLPNWVFSVNHLQQVGVDVDNCAAFDFVVSAKITETGQMLVSEQRVYWAPHIYDR